MVRLVLCRSFQAIALVNCGAGRTRYGGPTAASVRSQIELAEAKLADWEEAQG